MSLNLLIASRKQFHLGSDWWRLFTKSTLEAQFKEPIRWTLFDLNPDLVENRRKKQSWALQQSNSFHQESLSFIDGVVLAEPEEWAGPSLEVLYHLVNTFEAPLILFFPQMTGQVLSPLEKEVLASTNTFVLTNTKKTFDFFKNLGAQVHLQEKPLIPKFELPIEKHRQTAILFEMSQQFTTRFLGNEIRALLKQLKESHSLDTVQFFPVSVPELAYLSQIGIPQIFYNEDFNETLKQLAKFERIVARCPLIQDFAKAHQITVLSEKAEEFLPKEKTSFPNRIETSFIQPFIDRVKNHAPQIT